MTVDYAKHCRLQFGEYAQVNKVHDNTIQARVMGSITLHTTGNAKGVYYFMIIITGRRQKRQHFTPLTLPQELINRVHRLVCCNLSGLDVR